jgi:glycosyltransferase involved in cell wall biosynthesis
MSHPDATGSDVRMKILTVHNRYKIRGGEDESREAEDRLLAGRGHLIREVVLDNRTIQPDSWSVGLKASWSWPCYRQIINEARQWRPDLIDVHNFFPLASPAVHYAARRLGIPSLQTLHNYRLLCPAATFYRDGSPCEDCTQHMLPWPGVVHKCYHRSATHSGAVALMISAHRLMRTWQHAVTLFVAVSDFERRKFVDNGFPDSRVVVKPNFVPDCGGPGPGGDDFLFVGRLSPEKGISTLLQAASMVQGSFRLNIVGDGPLQPEVVAATGLSSRIRYLGRRSQSEVLDLIGYSRCLIFPSEWYETFGRVAAEAFARGTPVVAANIGAVAEIVDDGRTGVHFEPGDPADLARAIDWTIAHPDAIARMRVEARREYEVKYTADRNYELMMRIYERAIQEGTGRCSQ